MNKSLAAKLISIVLALLVWQIAAMAVNIEILLVSPIKVITRLAIIWMEPGFWSVLLYSFGRIVLGFTLAFVLGILLAVIAGRFSIVETLLWPYIVTIKAVPVASFIIISLIWLSSNQLAVFISFLMVLPIIYSNVLQGIKSTDPKLLEMASLYKVPWTRVLLYIYLPSIKPYLISACSVALGMSWKSGVAAEVIGVVNGSIGEMLYDAKIYFLTRDLFAWTVIIILISVVFEKVFLFLIRKVFALLENV